MNLIIATCVIEYTNRAAPALFTSRVLATNKSSASTLVFSMSQDCAPKNPKLALKIPS